MPLTYAFPRSLKSPPRYAAVWRPRVGCYQIEEDGRALGIFCVTEVEALAVAGALNFRRNILRNSLPVVFLAPGPFYVN